MSGRTRGSRLAAAAAACLLLSACAGLGAPRGRPAPGGLVDDAAAARRLLEEERTRARRSAGLAPAERVRRMTRLGLWGAADSLLATARAPDAELRLAEAELRFRQHRYAEAAGLVEQVLRAQPAHRGARLLLARLQIQAWQLPAATATARSLLAAHPRDEEAALLLGRIRVLEKDYGQALEWARRAQAWSPGSPGGHLLEADARFWNQDPAGAEEPLRRAIALAPFDPDARFSYGYAIWRRVDATQLGAMAAQWNLALEVDPLHYVTHWHLGNGHTHLTYADYAQPSDSTVRARLAPADSLIAASRIPEAIALARDVERTFPESVLPAMLRASAFYMAWDLDRQTRLDSAQAVFRSVLERRPNYGPAHNGLAAVIKQRQFAALARYDSLEAEIAATPLPRDPAFAAVFPDTRYYPGERVQRMVVQQLGPSLAYLPLIERQERRYRIPPLHRDLAAAMGSPFFRTATTFDNRQWMDIRGVGSGAAGIEYVERGSHQERNVLLHEFVHLFHQIVFTDAERRRVRELYHAAMREGRTLDYYAANNEHEFLAQAFPAYLSPVKVHPLNHKAMNTRADLLRKDPATFAFVDSLIARQRAYLAGDSSAFRSNWAQVYVNLSERTRQDEDRERAARLRRAAAQLDTALVWDAHYLPAMLSYAALLRDQRRFAEAERWLQRAEGVDPAYAPIFAARAELLGAERGGAGGGVDRQAALYRQALALERDLAVRAELNAALRRLLHAHGRVAEAVRVAEEYVADAPTVSTYLRDRRDEAAAFSHTLRSAAGYAAESLPFFRELVARKPQDYELRAQYADALTSAGRPAEAIATLEEAQRILSAGGTPKVGLQARIVENRLLLGDTARARAELEAALRGGSSEGGDLRLVRVLVSLGESTEAHRRLAQHPEPDEPRSRAELLFSRGWISERRADREMAERLYREALATDPYHRGARARLVRLLRRAGRVAEADAVLREAAVLPLPLGPDFAREVAGEDPVAGESPA